MAKVEYITCDICKSKDNVAQKNIDVIFNTDQTEGRSVKPYLSNEQVDVCKTCMDRILSTGRYIQAWGAMGYNEYKFKID